MLICFRLWTLTGAAIFFFRIIRGRVVNLSMKKTNQLCLDILKLDVHHARALANLVMAHSSHTGYSVTELCESPVYHYQYSSIADAVNAIAKDKDTLLSFEKQVQALCLNHYWSSPPGVPVILQTDKTCVVKRHSPTLEQRKLIAIPNSHIPGNAPIDIGYEYSFVNLYPGDRSWSLPLSCRNIPTEQTPSQVAAQQIKDLLQNQDLPLKDLELILNNLDSGYANVGYLENTKDLPNLVSILRLRASSKVHDRATESVPNKMKKIYQNRYYLIPKTGVKNYKKHPKTGEPYTVHQTSIFDKTPQKTLILDYTFSNGRMAKVHLYYWPDLLMRTKQGIKMHDKPFNLLAIQVFDATTQQLIFKDTMYIAAFGKRKDRIQAEQIYHSYQQRYGIEIFFRFAKQKLSLQKYQTCCSQHLHNWMYVISLSSWLLFTANHDLSYFPKKWQKYNASNKSQQCQNLSMTQAHRSLAAYLLTFDPTPFFPQKSKPGLGRQKGDTQIKRQKYNYVKKIQNTS